MRRIFSGQWQGRLECLLLDLTFGNQREILSRNTYVFLIRILWKFSKMNHLLSFYLPARSLAFLLIERNTWPYRFSRVLFWQNILKDLIKWWVKCLLPIVGCFTSLRGMPGVLTRGWMREGYPPKPHRRGIKLRRVCWRIWRFHGHEPVKLHTW